MVDPVKSFRRAVETKQRDLDGLTRGQPTSSPETQDNDRRVAEITSALAALRPQPEGVGGQTVESVVLSELTLNRNHGVDGRPVDSDFVILPSDTHWRDCQPYIEYSYGSYNAVLDIRQQADRDVLVAPVMHPECF